MDDDSNPPRGFTTAILHSDRDARRSSTARCTSRCTFGRLRLSRRARSRRRVPGPRAGLRLRPAGQSDDRRARSQSDAMEDGVATVCFATGMAAIGALMLALLQRRRPRRRQPVPVRQHGEPVQHARAHGAQITFVDATDVANVERAITPATRLVFVETIANPRTQIADLARIGALCQRRAEPALRRRQHDDLARAVPAEGRRRGARRQRADQVHRRARQRAWPAASPTPGLFDWTRFPNIADNYKSQTPALWGIHADPQEGAARLGRHARRRAGASHRGRRGDARAADGAHSARTRRRSPSFSPRIRSVRNVYYPGLPSHPQHALARSLFRRLRRALRVRARGRHRLLRFPESARRSSCCRRIWATTGRSRSRSRTRSSGRWAPARRAEMGIADSLIRVSVGIEDRDDLIADFAARRLRGAATAGDIDATPGPATP